MEQTDEDREERERHWLAGSKLRRTWARQASELCVLRCLGKSGRSSGKRSLPVGRSVRLFARSLCWRPVHNKCAGRCVEQLNRQPCGSLSLCFKRKWQAEGARTREIERGDSWILASNGGTSEHCVASRRDYDRSGCSIVFEACLLVAGRIARLARRD